MTQCSVSQRTFISQTPKGLFSPAVRLITDDTQCLEGEIIIFIWFRDPFVSAFVRVQNAVGSIEPYTPKVLLVISIRYSCVLFSREM